MSVIYTLLAAHFVADFIAQSDWMAVNKSKRWDALAWHVAVYTAVLAVFVFLLTTTPSWRGVTASWVAFGLFVGVNAVAHFVQDAMTSRITARLWFLNITATGETAPIWRGGGAGGARVEPLYAVEDTGTRHWFFVGIGADQLLHYVTLFVTAGWWLI
jgi:hypothetical protein